MTTRYGHLSTVLEEIGRGEELAIAKAGRPIAKLSAYDPAAGRIRPPGSMKSEIRMA